MTLPTSWTDGGPPFHGSDMGATNTAVNANTAFAATKGQPNGIAPLDGSSKVPTANSQTEVTAHTNLAAFPGTGVTNHVYIANDTNKVYRWSGSAYQEIGGGAAGLTSTDSLPEGTTNLYYTNARADARVAGQIAPGTHAAAGKTPPVDADEIPITDSAASFALKKLTFANLKAWFKAYYDTVVSAPTHKDLTDGTNTFPTLNQNTTGSAAKLTTARNIDGQAFDGTADVTVVAPAIHAATLKSSPVDADELGLVDSAASNVLKRITWSNLKSTIKSYYDSVISAPTNKDLTSGTNTFPTFNQNTTGSAATAGSAATLTTPRNIDGQAFDGSANVTVIAPGTHAATGKTTPVDADELPIVDSAASNVLKKVTFANLKLWVKAYYDSVTSVLTNKSIDATTNTLTNIPLASLSGAAVITSSETIAANNTDSAVATAAAVKAYADSVGGGGSGIPPSVGTTKGDLIVFSAASTPARMGVTGVDGRVLHEKASATNGVEWVTLGPSDVALGNVNNTSDVLKPVSTAQAYADASIARRNNAIANTKRRTFWQNVTATSSPSTTEDIGGTVQYSAGVPFPFLVKTPIGSVTSRLTFSPTSGANFIYRDFDESAQVTRVGCEFSFETFGKATAFGGVCLAILNDFHGNQGLTSFRLLPHYVVTPLGISISKATNASGTLVFTDMTMNLVDGGSFTGTYNFATALTNSTMQYTTEIVISGNTLWIYLPDGNVCWTSDTDIATYTGAHAFHELSTGAADTDCIPGLSETWGDVGFQAPPGQRYTTTQQVTAAINALVGADIPTAIHAASSKTTPVDADELALTDSAASYVLKKLTWANLKATVKAYYDSVVSVLTNKDLTSGTNTFPTFNQNTTGSAAKWTTARNIAGNSVDGSAAVPFPNKFIVQGTADAGLTGAQFTGALATGLVKNTTTTGVLSIAAAGTDYVGFNAALGTPTSGSLVNCTFPTLNQNTTGSAAKWTTARNVDGQALDGTADVTVIAPGTHAATGKTTPVDADELPLVDSAASNVLKKLTWANLKATIKAYYDSVTSSLTNKDLTSGTNTFPTFNQNTTGSAAKLTTARNINGVAFDGTAAITITKRKVAPAIAGTYTLDVTATDLYAIGVTGTPQNAAITNFTTTGSLSDDQDIDVRIIGDATPRAITWDTAKFATGPGTLLATTAASKTHLIKFKADTNLGKLVCVACDAVGY